MKGNKKVMIAAMTRTQGTRHQGKGGLSMDRLSTTVAQKANMGRVGYAIIGYMELFQQNKVWTVMFFNGECAGCTKYRASVFRLLLDSFPSLSLTVYLIPSVRDMNTFPTHFFLSI